MSTVSRPVTVQSDRARTARPATGTLSHHDHEGSHVVAVIEGRGVSREIGIAALDRDTGGVRIVQVQFVSILMRLCILMLSQLADSQTYVKTLHQMHLHYPALILVPHTLLSEDEADGTSSSTSLLVQSIMDEFTGVPVEPVQRKYWNDMAGTS
jgi:DNA mismatch repair protein MSH4